MAEPARTLAMGQDEATAASRAAVDAPFGQAVAALGRERPEIVGLTADLGKYTDILPFRDVFPERFFNVGMAEQNLIAVAAGLARTGKIPFATTYGVFATRRAYDFIAIAVAHSRINVKIIAGLPGLTTGYGGTHQAIEDLALMRMIPGLVVIDPCDATDITQATAAMADHDGPVYMRLLRGRVPVVLDPASYRFAIGKAARLRDGKDVGIVATGLMTERALDAAAALSGRGIDVGVLHVPTLKPFDADAVAEFAASVDRIVTAENHVKVGGLASLVAETLFERGVVKPLTRIGLPDAYIECGSVPHLQTVYGLSTDRVIETVAAAGLNKMRIAGIETYTVGAGWKNWLFIKVNTDEGPHGVGEGTLNGFIRTTEAGIRELEHLVIGEDPRRVRALAKRMLDSVSLDGGHIHRTVIAAVEFACWDILGKSLGAPVHQLLGGRVRDSVLGYANGWYRTERTPEAFLAAAREVIAKGFKAFKVDPFGTAQGFISEPELELAADILGTLRATLPRDTLILIDVHARFTEVEAIRAAHRLAPLNLYWWEEPTTRDRQETVHAVGHRSPIPVATGEMYDTVGQFFTLAAGGGVNIFQPEPMSLGGIANTLAVADLALAHGSYIAPHQSGGPIATAVCLQLAACVPNFLIQEHFDAFNEPWTHDLVTWHPTIDPKTGHLSLPDGPGLGIDLNVEVAREHPYDPKAYLNIFEDGWEKRLGTRRSEARPRRERPRR